ncbi:phosphoribosyltransferase [Marinitenerispora sediminis]|uniref:Phosphoribosyltransferase n=1 Tax=Marinitenerispora sediminis TaxID=1931232 RepID=A0A368SYZ3_9ACTN|nr:phosphoribosyltransferase family protein [Marinitenerispora sediminis]RCV50186.1 phosphoribosyltransferase [Marinitenerispora sediminis]RCV52262.1 phosphoribosyltransferase [Marinitenerispora sediminis]RCV56891.1 phosphoribosyltransferase [Marinitenerispora sediminis]
MRGFRDRTRAGELLAERLTGLGLARPYVLALPRGGVQVAVPVARALSAPLDVLVVRKIGAPDNPELGIGAVTAHGPVLLDDGRISRLGIDQRAVVRAVERERAEARRRLLIYREGRRAPEVGGRDVIVVDDGLATGVTARAALRDLAARDPASTRLAVPVGSATAVAGVRRGGDCDEVVCLLEPVDFHAVGLWYEDFPQLSDDEVVLALHEASGGSVRGR